MIYLLLSILTSVIVVCYFKLFDKYNVNTLQAIVVNYLTCVVMGNLLADKPGITTQFWVEGWFPFTLILGFLFISVFYSIAQSAQKMGVSITMVAGKLSVALPVLFAIFLDHEPFGLIKLSGIILSMLAVYFISKTGENSPNKKLWYLPLYIFIGSGFIDAILNYLDKQYIPPFDTNHILSFVFLTAFTLGSILLIYQYRKGERITLKNILWGIALGIPNYMCMFFLLKMLDAFPHASVILPINNIGVVMLTTLAGLSLFKEKLSNINWLGLGLAILSIIILSYS
ncbi:MAG: EamA family transporter [Bacteroidota bacterium]